MTYGRLAQLVEHLLDVQEVTGSSPVPSTTSPDHSVWGFFVVCGTGLEPEQVKAGYHHEGGILPFAIFNSVWYTRLSPVNWKLWR